MPEYRDPKVTSPTKAGGMGKWIGIALAVLVALLVLWWLLSGDDAPEAMEEPAAVETAPEGVEPAPAD